MKKSLLYIFIALFSISTFAQEITGKWNGLLSVQGIQLRLVFNIDKSENGFTATMDSPDQGATGIPVTEITYKEKTLNLIVANASIEYEGVLDENDVISGTFSQAGQSIPMSLTRHEQEKEKVVKIQDPVKPYPYVSEDVNFENKNDRVVLSGTLTLPKEKGVFPAVILISGSGPQNRDEEILGHKPFLVLADYLTKNGIAVLRYDDRGTAESTGDFSKATSVDFANDVKSAVTYLKSRKEIDNHKIGLIGHSEGGLIAPMVANDVDDIKFIVLLAGPGIPGNEILILQTELIGRVQGKDQNEIDKEIANLKTIFDKIRSGKSKDSLINDLKSYMNEYISQNPEILPEGIDKDQFIDYQINQMTSPWMSYFINYDPANALEKVKCAVLALNGEKDTQVPPKENLSAIEIALKKGGNMDYKIKEMPSLNHLFQEAKTGSPYEYGTIEQTFSPKALEEISNWIDNQVK